MAFDQSATLSMGKQLKPSPTVHDFKPGFVCKTKSTRFKNNGHTFLKLSPHVFKTMAETLAGWNPWGYLHMGVYRHMGVYPYVGLYPHGFHEYPWLPWAPMGSAGTHGFL